jgi:CRISPR-associated endonuclease/helicase Cas3
MTMVYAHSPNNEGRPHGLVEHLTYVAKMAAEFAGKFGAADFGYWAGLWHDLGKFHPDFQAYLMNPTARRGPDHSSAGSLLAGDCFPPIAFLVAGHHGGLPSQIGLKERLLEKATKPAMSQALARARQDIQTLEPTISLESALPEFLRGKTHTSHAKAQLRQRLELFIRMVFSALVDADFLDTEHHFDPSRSHRRGSSVGLDELWKQLEVAQAAFGNYEPGSLNALRHEIYEACVRVPKPLPVFLA